ncbi:E3 ubiquitin-protein ligase-like protein isoform X2 [Cinnamomum micranthum f. kanehirae]|uniref:RING-type E3 ubiquitin transferase n=1 Tax=Cinnamomum micranthum f. kanehirae TaxID=337451 RepID=A0A3S3MWL9_9MAGN|nr:E3 ubiquitin-protein ligase-like protein isoform X2 [Cinnamomum micranthum f. kanehirae]
MERPSNPASDDTVDQRPLLRNTSSNRDDDRSRRPSRRPSLRGAARFLRQASSRRIMREPSMLVRETAAEQLEERQSDWAYSRPVVVLDLLWNLAFVVVAAAVLVSSRDEDPSMPLRLWIVGYALQCLLHMVCVCVEYRRRHHQVQGELMEDGSGSRSGRSSSSSSQQDVEEDGVYDAEQTHPEERTSVAKHLESANTMFSFIWWIIGFYWVSAGGQTLTRDAPHLYWLCIVFLAFDVFFVVFCVALACVVGIAVCCCLPCIIAILYAVADQEGASDEDIRQLPKYKFQKICEKLTGETSEPSGGIMTECGTDTPVEHVLSAEDAECCICLSSYDDGVELRELPCSHHFHCACIDKWLYINATCPLCKYNIIKSTCSSREDV